MLAQDARDVLKAFLIRRLLVPCSTIAQLLLLLLKRLLRRMDIGRGGGIANAGRLMTGGTVLFSRRLRRRFAHK